MAELSFVCPRARADDNGAHDIWDARDESSGITALVCRRCGQTVTLQDALAATSRDPDRPGTA